ncbi:hypothetical protein J6590_101514 [Homalodisca vitripennis]|nr:hypothetical protein J6590_101514 [Homalodisca vitripennis]
MAALLDHAERRLIGESWRQRILYSVYVSEVRPALMLGLSSGDQNWRLGWRLLAWLESKK